MYSESDSDGERRKGKHKEDEHDDRKEGNAKQKAKDILDDIMDDSVSSVSSSDEEGKKGKKGKFSGKLKDTGGRSGAGTQAPGPSGNLWYFQSDKSLQKACLNSQLQFPQDYQPYDQKESNKISEAYNQGRDLCDLGKWIVYYNQTVETTSIPRRLVPAPGEHVQVRQGTNQPFEKFRAVTLPSNWNPNQPPPRPQQQYQQPTQQVQVPLITQQQQPQYVGMPTLHPPPMFGGFPRGGGGGFLGGYGHPLLPSVVPPVGRFGYGQPSTATTGTTTMPYFSQYGGSTQYTMPSTTTTAGGWNTIASAPFQGTQTPYQTQYTQQPPSPSHYNHSTYSM